MINSAPSQRNEAFTDVVFSPPETENGTSQSNPSTSASANGGAPPAPAAGDESSASPGAWSEEQELALVNIYFTEKLFSS